MSPFTPRGGNPCVNRSDVMGPRRPGQRRRATLPRTTLRPWLDGTTVRGGSGHLVGRDAEGFICRLACAHFGAGEGET